jgi:uncharacterized coiled-coil protein SlyX
MALYFFHPDGEDAMTDNVENLVLEHLRHIRNRIDRVADTADDIKSRLTSLEITTAGIRRDLAHMYGDIVEQHVRVDQLTARIERIERRLDLANTST